MKINKAWISDSPKLNWHARFYFCMTWPAVILWIWISQKLRSKRVPFVTRERMVEPMIIQNYSKPAACCHWKIQMRTTRVIHATKGRLCQLDKRLQFKSRRVCKFATSKKWRKKIDTCLKCTCHQDDLLNKRLLFGDDWILISLSSTSTSAPLLWVGSSKNRTEFDGQERKWTFLRYIELSVKWHLISSCQEFERFEKQHGLLEMLVITMNYGVDMTPIFFFFLNWSRNVL